MYTVLVNKAEIQAALSASRSPRGNNVLCVDQIHHTHQIDMVRQRKNGPLQVRIQRDQQWISPVTTYHL